MAIRPWRSKSMILIFKTSWDNLKMHILCKFGNSSSNPLQFITWTSQISLNYKLKWPKWPWRSRSKASNFNTIWEYPKLHVWCKSGLQKATDLLSGRDLWPPLKTRLADKAPAAPIHGTGLKLSPCGLAEIIGNDSTAYSWLSVMKHPYTPWPEPPRAETDHPTLNHSWFEGRLRVLYFPRDI